MLENHLDISIGPVSEDAANAHIDKLYATFGSGVLQYAMRLTRDSDMAGELHDNAFLSLHGAMREREVPHVRRYLFDHVRGQVAVYDRQEGVLSIGDDFDPVYHVPDDETVRDDIYHKIRDGLAAAMNNTDLFTAEEKRVIEGLVDSKSIDEIASEMGADVERIGRKVDTIRFRIEQAVPEIKLVIDSKAA